MKTVIENARKQRDVTQKQAADRMFLTLRQYQRLENGEQPMTAEQAAKLAKILDCPAITAVYCASVCAIGRRYCYPVLNNVDLSPIAILTKYRQEAREAAEALERLTEIVLNKTGAGDCTDVELAELRKCALELLDIEHVVETLKLRLWDFVDVEALIREHNDKCLQKRYYDPRRPELQLAG